MLFLTKRRISRAQQRYWDRAEACEERNLAWREMHEWTEKVEAARRNRWPMPVGGGLIKARYEISSGLQGKESGWDIDTIPIADFGNVNLAAAGTIRTGVNTFPLVNPTHTVQSSPDPLPYELSTLAAASGGRVAGSSTNPLAILVGVYLVRITSAAAVYLPVTTTINVRVVSTVSAVGGAFTTVATFNASAGTNFVESIAIASPAERQVATPTGTLLTTAAGVFNGDSTFVELVAAAALNVQSNLLYVELEVI